MGAYYCPACYGRRVHCRRCKTDHCQCSWNRCPKKSAPRGMVCKLSDPLYDNDTPARKKRARVYYQPYGQSVPAAKLGGNMAKKKPLDMMFDGISHKPVVVVARVRGCTILSGLKNKPLSERKMNKTVRGVKAVCDKRGVDCASLGRELIRLGKKLRGKDSG